MIKYFGFTLLLCFATLSYATPAAPKDHPWEITAGYGTGNVFNFNDSTGVREYRVAGGFFPSEWIYHGFELGGEFSYAHLHNNDVIYNGTTLTSNDLTVASLTPVIRWYMLDATHLIQPFLEGGAGPGWMSASQFKDRDLGIHFTFQDFFGIGAMINTQYPLLFGLRIIHYSNCGISENNAGVTMPVLVYTGVRF